MPVSKKQRMQQIRDMENVFEWDEYNSRRPFPRGEWNEQIFRNDHPIYLELACGKGEYSVGLAAIEPEANFVGIDIKGNRIWVGARKAQKNFPDRVRFLRAYIDHLEQFFGEEEVSGIWIIFPDPQIRKNRKKLTSPKFLDIYRKILSKDARINLKTDSPELYHFTKTVITENGLRLHTDIPDVYAEEAVPAELSIQTYYEKKHLQSGRTIHFLSFSL